MPRRDERHRHSRPDINPITPIESLRGYCGIVISHNGVITERRDDAHTMGAREPRQGHDIEMIVMAVRYQHDIDRRQILKCDTRIVDALWPDKAERGGSLRPHRIEQDVDPRSLDEPARMADIANAPA